MTTLYSQAIGVIGGDFVLLFNLTATPSTAGSVPIVNLYVENPSVGSIVQDNPDVSISTTLPGVTPAGTQVHPKKKRDKTHSFCKKDSYCASSVVSRCNLHIFGWI